ncbi:MAG: kynureninase [Marivirga sp.]|nr:kynureninase [Marivirga sp.]
MDFNNTLSFAKKMDREDPLRNFRKKFLIPQSNGTPIIYFTGNSLGLQPKTIKQFITEELDDWAALGVEGHLHSRRPWLYYHKFTKGILAKLVGGRASEVVAMNQLTVNLHLMMVSFYRPTKKRYKILTEAGAFSSDQYAFESQMKFHGLDPQKALVEINPRKGEKLLRTDDILSAIKENGSELALVIFGGVQYYTGQFFNIKKITEAGHKAGAVVGFDLAHAIGNVPLALHRHEVDFAVWCGYKYLNSGPGAISGVFVHERHAKKFQLPRFAGWWGHDEKVRFQMKKGFQPMEGVDGFQLSNVPIFQSAAHLASLEIFQQATFPALRKKSLLLTGYLEFLLNEFDPKGKYYNIITSKEPTERGCQLSIYIKRKGRIIFSRLLKRGVSADWREPDVIRVAPVPLYNTFEEVFLFVEIFKHEIRNA